METRKISSIEKVRRSAYVNLRLSDEPALDAGALLRGEIRKALSVKLRARSPIGEREISLTGPESELLRRLPATEWTSLAELEAAGYPATLVERLAEHAVVITDSNEPTLAAIRRREDLLTSTFWPPTAAHYHAVSQLRVSGPASDLHDGPESPDAPPVAEAGMLDELRRHATENAARFIEQHGPPPPLAVQRGDAEHVVELPVPSAPKRGFYEVLAQRRSWRTFERRPIDRDQLAAILYWVFACHGTIEIGAEYRVQHKTSPSGGGLHPIEAYPIVFDVAGLEPGVYHYRPMDHSLAPLRKSGETAFGRRELRQRVVEIATGQDYVGEAAMVCLLTARFGRNFWKYRGVDRSYGVILQDLGHLSQSFYLVAAEMNLGALYTAAIDSEKSAACLGLEPMEEGPLGLCVLGVPDRSADDWLPIRPHQPER